FLEPLRIDLVLLGEFVALGSIESVKGADSLRGERFAIHEEKDAAELFAFKQPINLGHDQEGFACAGGHGDEKFALAGKQSGFSGGAGRVSLGLFENILRTNRNFFGLKDAEQSAGNEQSIVSGAIGSGEFG